MKIAGAPLGMKIATIEVRPGGAATSCTEAKF